MIDILFVFLAISPSHKEMIFYKGKSGSSKEPEVVLGLSDVSIQLQPRNSPCRMDPNS